MKFRFDFPKNEPKVSLEFNLSQEELELLHQHARSVLRKVSREIPFDVKIVWKEHEDKAE